VDSKTSVMGHVTLNSCFPSGGIWGSRMHPYASGAQYGDALSFMLGWAGVVSIKNALEQITSNLFLHPVGSMGHVMHSGASRARSIDV
jgi:hypothetical protein